MLLKLDFYQENESLIGIMVADQYNNRLPSYVIDQVGDLGYGTQEIEIAQMGVFDLLSWIPIKEHQEYELPLVRIKVNGEESEGDGPRG